MIGTIAAPVLDVVVDGGGLLFALLPLELVDELESDDPPRLKLLGPPVSIGLELLVLPEAGEREEVIMDPPELEGMVLVDADKSEVVGMDPFKLEGLIPVNDGTEPEAVPAAGTIMLFTWRG